MRKFVVFVLVQSTFLYSTLQPDIVYAIENSAGMNNGIHSAIERYADPGDGAEPPAVYSEQGTNEPRSEVDLPRPQLNTSAKCSRHSECSCDQIAKSNRRRATFLEQPTPGPNVQQYLEAATTKLRAEYNVFAAAAVGIKIDRSIDVVPVRDRWDPTAAEISQIQARGKARGLSFEESDVLRAAPFLRQDDSIETKEATVTIAAAIALGIAIGALEGLAFQTGECIGSAIWGDGEECACPKFFVSMAWGALWGGIGAAVLFSLGLLSPAAISVAFFGQELGITTVSELTGLLVDQYLEPMAEWQPICLLIKLSSLSTDEWGDYFVDLTWRTYGVDLMFLASMDNPESPQPATGLGLQIRGSDGSMSAVYESSDEIEFNVSFFPAQAGVFSVGLVARHEGQDFTLHNSDITVDQSEIGTQFTVPITRLASILLGLHDSNSEDFLINASVSNGAWSNDILASRRPTLRISDPANLNHLPSLRAQVAVSGNLLSVEGTYFDQDGNAPSLVEVVIDGSDYFPTLVQQSTQEWSVVFSEVLNDGYHDVFVRYSDGGSTTQNSETWHVRTSATPSQVELTIGDEPLEVGESIAFEATVSDGAGIVPEREVRLARDLRGVFRDTAGNPVFRLMTDVNGSILGTYTPTVPGTHMLLFQDTESKNFDYAEIAVGGSSPSDWTMQWNWNVISNSPTSATYGCQVLVQYQGENLDIGHDIQFAANHGSFQDAMDEVMSNGTVDNVYTLSKTEADSGNEVFTLTLPSYGVELTYSTNLPVGDPDPLQYVNTTNLNGSTQVAESFSVAFSKDGRYAARSSNTSVVIYNFPEMTHLRTVNPDWDYINGICFSPDGNKIAAGDDDGWLTVINVGTGSWTRTNVTDGSVAITNVDWYDTDRIAVATEGRSSTGFSPRVVITSSAPSVVGSPIFFSELTPADDINRIDCVAATQKCAMASDNGWWYFFSPNGTKHYDGEHPEGHYVWTVRFNAEGNKLFVGGHDYDGSTWRYLYSVSGTSLSTLSNPLSSNADIYASEFFETATGQDRLAIGGRSRLEVFDDDGGAVLLDIADPIGASGEESYHIEYLTGPKMLVAVNNNKQVYYNLSGDEFGPSIYCPDPPSIPYRETSTTLAGNIDDPAGVENAEYQIGAGAPNPLSLDGSGNFSFTVSSLPVGDTTVTIRAWDTFNNQNTHSVTVTREDDDEAPMISSAQVSPGSGLPGTVFTISCEIIDFDAEVASASANIKNGSGAVIATKSLVHQGNDVWSTTWDSTGATVGSQYSVDISAVDSSPNANSRTVTSAAGFSVDDNSNSNPNTPSNPSPSNGQNNVMVTTNLAWTGGDPDAGDVVTYDVYLEPGDASPDTLVCDDAATATCNPPGSLSNDTNYYWQVVARDGDGATTAGPVWSFRTEGGFDPSVHSDGFESGNCSSWSKVVGLEVPPVGGILLQDDFSDGDASGWQTFATGWSESGGEYHATNTAGNTPVSSVWADGYGWTDYSVEADVTPLSSYSPSGAGIVFRFQNPYPDADFCDCVLGRGGYGVILKLSCPGVLEYLPFNHAVGQTYRLRATAVGQDVSCEIVGEPGTKITAAAPVANASGTVGFRGTHVPVDFDNVIVQEISSLDDGLVGSYSLEGDAADSSGNDHDGILRGDPPFGTGIVGSAVHFDNQPHTGSFYVNDYFEIPGPISLDSVSVAMWLKFEYSAYTPGGATVYSLGSDDNDGEYLGIWATDGGLGVNLHIPEGSAGIYPPTFPVGETFVGQWHHVAVTADSTEIRLYIDGDLHETIATGFPVSFTSQKQFLAFHQWYHGSGGASRLNGWVDEVRVYDRTISAQEVSAIYASSAP